MKKSKHQLEDHYCGDEAWMEFARVVRASSTDWNS
jgi:hypothetical protein